mgnify:CR=1 FL=1
MKNRQLQGQTIFITVLVLTIALTVVLSLMRRTTTDIKITGQLEESARAFSAAEAGIEDVLKRGSGTTVSIQSGSGEATFETTFTNISGTSSNAYQTATEKGDVATIWLVPHKADNSLDETGPGYYCETVGVCTIDVCWNQPTSPTEKPAVEMMVLYKTVAGTYNINRSAYDPDITRTGNSFTKTGIDTAGCGKTGIYHVLLTLPTTNARPLALRLRPYYNGTTVMISPIAPRTLLSQGFEVSSTGKTESGVTRKIVVKKRYDAPSSFFDFVLYANSMMTNEAYLQISLSM